MVTLCGWIDVAQRTRLSGWAECGADPVILRLFAVAGPGAASRPLLRFVANRYRADRDPDATGWRGRAGFDLDLRDLPLPAHSFLLDVRDDRSGARLPGAPCLIPACGFAPAPAPYRLVAVDGCPASLLPGDIAGVVCASPAWCAPGPICR